MKILALLTARGNNTLKDKNILTINGLPVLAYPALAAKKIKIINDFFISSDSDKILKVGYKYGYLPIKRPKSISKKNSLHIDALNHALTFLINKKMKYDFILVLLGNSPTVKYQWIKKAINIINTNKKITSVVPVVKFQDYHPYRSKTLANDGSLKSFFKFNKKISSNRQDLPPAFFLCHNFWLIKLEKGSLPSKGEAPWNFLGKKVFPLEISSSIDIHEYDDLKESSLWLKKNNIKY